MAYIGFLGTLLFFAAIASLPSYWASTNLDGIDISYYFLPNTPGFVIFLFCCGLCYGLHMVAIFEAAIVTEKIAKRPFLGWYQL